MLYMALELQNTLDNSLLSDLRIVAPLKTDVAAVQTMSAEQSTRVQYASVVVSSSEILNLNATPKVLVAAPGAGFVLEFLSAVFILDYETTPYATNGVLSIRETNDAGAAHSEDTLLADFLAKTADTILPVRPVVAVEALAANTPMVLSAATAETTNGDSPMTVKVAYRVHATGL